MVEVDSPFGNILLNLFSEALWDVTRRVAGASLTSPPSLSVIGEAIEEAVEDSIAQLEWDHPDPRLEEVCLFLGSPDVKSLVQQVFAAVMSERRRGTQIKETFLGLWRHTFGDRRVKEAEALLMVLLGAAEKALRVAIERNVLAAHEAAAARRHDVLLDYLAALETNLRLLIHTKPLVTLRVREFAERFEEVALMEHGLITPPSLDQEIRLPMDDLYVFPTFKKDDQPTSYSKLASGLDRAVVLGNPGAGKSTLSSRIAYGVLKHEDGFAAQHVQLPFVVPLFAYGESRDLEQRGLVTYLEHLVRTKYQVAPGEGIIEFLLLNGRAVVIFDGMDELQDTTRRRTVRNDIEKFSILYPSARVLVTSREIGYDQAPLRDTMFPVYRIAPFEDPQIADYVTKWYRARYAHEEAASRSQAFLKEARRVSDLTSNPLMLALMCNIHRGGDLPPNRPALYRECALMMFERWDRSRGLKRDLPYPSHLEKILRHLATWLLNEKSDSAGVTRSELTERVKSYIQKELNDDPEEAESAAGKWIDFFQGRAWVFTDVGSLATGESTYHFAHPTFLEFFTASHAVSVFPTPSELIGHLLPYLRRTERDVVAQLACQLQAATVDRAADSQLDLLLDAARHDPPPIRVTLLSFAARMLEFQVPSPAAIRNLVRDVFREVCEWGSGLTRLRPSDPYEGQNPLDLLEVLLYSAAENRPRVVQEIERHTSEVFATASIADSMTLAKTVLHLSTVIAGSTTSQSHDDSASSANSIACRFAIDNRARLLLHARHSLPIARAMLLLEAYSIPQMASELGVDALFAAPYTDILPKHRFPSVAEVTLQRLLARAENVKKDRMVEKMLAGFAAAFDPLPPPFLCPRDRFAPGAPVITRPSPVIDLSLSGNALFGLFVILAVMREAGAISQTTIEAIRLGTDFREYPGLLERQSASVANLRSKAPRGWDQRQRDIAERWASGEHSFTQEVATRDPGERTIYLKSR